MRLSRWSLLWLLVVGVLVAIEVSVITGVLSVNNLLGFFILFIYALVVITVMAIVGAVFVGIFISHRILSTKGFTPFEQEMLQMRQDVRELGERIEDIAGRLGLANPGKPKGP